MNEIIAPGEEPERKPSRAVAKAERNTPVTNRADPMNMIAAAIQKGLGIDVIKEIVGLQERLDATQAVKAFNLAMAALKEELPVILKNQRVKYESAKEGVKNGKVDYVHEDMAQIARQIDPLLSKHGLSYRFRISQPAPGFVTVTCVIAHELGHFEENPMTAAIDQGAGKNHIQAIGSATTYLSRYTLKAALGLAASEDDDGQSAGGERPRPPVPSASGAQSAPAGKQKPHAITGGKNAADWAKLYIAALKTSDSYEEMKEWDRLNDPTLFKIDNTDGPVYAEIEKAFNTHQQHLEQKARAGRPDPISTGRQAPHQGEGIPDIETEYEDWLKWAHAKIAEQADPEVLETFYNTMIDGVSGIFPSDRDALTAAYQAKDKALTTQ